MGSLVSVSDAPAVIATAEEMFRSPLSSPVYGQKIGEFTRSEAGPDIDVYNTGALLKNTEVFVAVFPSFMFFDEVLDSGNVTIEVLDDSGSVFPSTPVTLPSTAYALAMVKFTTGASDAVFYYRLTPESGLVHGEYLLADNGPQGSVGPPVGRRLQNGLDGNALPFDLNIFSLYTDAADLTRITNFDIGGVPLTATGETIRIGFVPGGSAVDFKVTSNSSQPEVQRVLLSQGGNIFDNTNLTLVDGDVDFQVATTEAEPMFMVLKFEIETELQIEAMHAGESSVATHACVIAINCPASTITITGLEANDLVAVDLKMAGNLNANNRAIPFVDSNTGAAYGSFRTTQNCPSNFADSGVIFAPTTATGSVEFDIAPPAAIQGCLPELGIKASAIGINEYLGVDLTSFSNSVRSTCERANCTSGSFEFSSANGFGTVSNLTMLVQGFAGNRLTLSMDNNVFYNETFDESCTDDPAILQDLALPAVSGNQQSLSIQFELEDPTTCTDRQNLMLGVVGFTDATASPSIRPPSGASVADDVPLVAGLSTAAVFLVLGSLLFLFYRSSARAVSGSAELVVKQKEDA